MSMIGNQSTPVVGAGMTKSDGTQLLPATPGTDFVAPGTATNFTSPQRAAITTDNDLSFDLGAKQHFKCTPTAGGALTFTNISDGLPVTVLLVNGSNYAITAHANTKISAADLAAISATGTYLLSGLSDGTNVYLVASRSLA